MYQENVFGKQDAKDSKIHLNHNYISTVDDLNNDISAVDDLNNDVWFENVIVNS